MIENNSLAEVQQNTNKNTLSSNLDPEKELKNLLSTNTETVNNTNITTSTPITNTLSPDAERYKRTIDTEIENNINKISKKYVGIPKEAIAKAFDQLKNTSQMKELLNSSNPYSYQFKMSTIIQSAFRDDRIGANGKKYFSTNSVLDFLNQATKNYSSTSEEIEAINNNKRTQNYGTATENVQYVIDQYRMRKSSGLENGSNDKYDPDPELRQILASKINSSRLDSRSSNRDHRAEYVSNAFHLLSNTSRMKDLKAAYPEEYYREMKATMESVFSGLTGFVDDQKMNRAYDTLKSAVKTNSERKDQPVWQANKKPAQLQYDSNIVDFYHYTSENLNKSGSRDLRDAKYKIDDVYANVNDPMFRGMMNSMPYQYALNGRVPISSQYTGLVNSMEQITKNNYYITGTKMPNDVTGATISSGQGRYGGNIGTYNENASYYNPDSRNFYDPNFRNATSYWFGMMTGTIKPGSVSFDAYNSYSQNPYTANRFPNEANTLSQIKQNEAPYRSYTSQNTFYLTSRMNEINGYDPLNKKHNIDPRNPNAGYINLGSENKLWSHNPYNPFEYDHKNRDPFSMKSEDYFRVYGDYFKNPTAVAAQNILNGNVEQRTVEKGKYYLDIAEKFPKGSAERAYYIKLAQNSFGAKTTQEARAFASRIEKL